MAYQGDVEIIHNWREEHSIEDLQRIVERKGYSAFSVGSFDLDLINAELPWQSKNIKKGNVGSVKSKCVFEGSLTKAMNPHLHKMNMNISSIY